MRHTVSHQSSPGRWTANPPPLHLHAVQPVLDVVDHRLDALEDRMPCRRELRHLRWVGWKRLVVALPISFPRCCLLALILAPVHAPAAALVAGKPRAPLAVGEDACEHGRVCGQIGLWSLLGLTMHQARNGRQVRRHGHGTSTYSWAGSRRASGRCYCHFHCLPPTSLPPQGCPPSSCRRYRRPSLLSCVVCAVASGYGGLNL